MDGSSQREDSATYRWALLVSLSLHLLLIALLLIRSQWGPDLDPLDAELMPPIPNEILIPVSLDRQAPAAAAGAPASPPPQPDPREFEYYDLPERDEEPPRNPDAPLSDRDRRAHGGEGEPADTPGVEGTTRQLVQSDGGDRLGGGAPGAGRDSAGAGGEGTGGPAENGELPPGESHPQQELVQPSLAPTRPPALLPEQGVGEAPPGLGGGIGGFGELQESPDRSGGRVDGTGLSFDTQWYEWGPYAKRMLAKIKRNWYARMPEIAMLGAKGVVKIRYFIERDGTVTGLQIIDESGRPPMDFAARDAISASSPFEPLPADLTGVDREGVTITFYYNLHPPDRGEE